MGEKHKVVQGEHFAAIAAAKGHQNFLPPWNAAENESVRTKRKTPHILLPGDEVEVPELAQKDEQAPTEKKTRFQVSGVKLKLRLEIRTVSNDPAKKVPCSLTVEGADKTEDLDGQGRIERLIPNKSKAGKVVIRDATLPLTIEDELEIGGLHPLDTVTGQIGRLNNLGYDAGPLEEPTSADAKLRFRSAVEEFQCENGLKVDGVCGSGTQSKLKEVHGC
ncbi:hypothetical protein PHYC_03015 [Phycisphaerales bacterium]|nr:hypothetical protein PHYC_03015 [Phycisphaerales bacterium]